MRPLLGAGVVVLLAAATAAAQDRTTLYSTPTAPPREALDRLSLKMAWQNSVPMDGRQDGFLSLVAAGPHLLAQTRSGLVCLINAEDGRILWQTRLGKAYAGTVAPGFNSYTVVVVNNGIIYGLDRDSGRINWEYPVPTGLAVSPVCDEDNVYVCTTGKRVFAFRLPRGELDAVPLIPGQVKPITGPKPGSTKPGYEALAARLAVVPLWDAPVRFAIELPPVSGGDVVLLAGADGMVTGLTRSGVSNFATSESFRWFAEGPILVQPGVYDDTAYVGSQDFNLYSTSMTSGKQNWRYTAGSPITRRPIALEKDVYVVSERGGMARLDRLTGEPLWKLPRGREVTSSNPDLDRFLAANPKFVYALDRVGRLVVADRNRGVVLGTLDVRDFVYPVPNEITDRLFLAAHNGLIVCLHDRDYATALRHRKIAEPSGLDASKLPFDPQVKAALSLKLARPPTKPFSIPAGQLTPLREALLAIRQDYDVRISISEKAYREMNKMALLETPIKAPKSEGVTLGDMLQDILRQADSDYVVLDSIVVYPKRGAGGERPPDRPPEKPPEKPPERP
jgi:outer membrane protein assembly factor BamB